MGAPEANKVEMTKINSLELLIEAIESKNLEQATSRLLSVRDINQANHAGKTPLCTAVSSNDLDMVTLLLGRDDINVNKAGDDHDTPLCIAVSWWCDSNIAKLLLENPDIDVNIAGHDGYTPLSKAVIWNRRESVNLLLKKPKIEVNEANRDSTPLHLATINGHTEHLRWLLAIEGIEVNKAGEDRMTALHLATQLNHFECFKELLKANGINVNQANHEGKTPLHIAIELGRTEYVKALLDAKEIYVNKANSKGLTPLHCAVDFMRLNIIQLLLQQPGIKIDKPNNNNETALACALAKLNKKSEDLTYFRARATHKYDPFHTKCIKFEKEIKEINKVINILKSLDVCNNKKDAITAFQDSDVLSRLTVCLYYFYRNEWTLARDILLAKLSKQEKQQLSKRQILDLTMFRVCIACCPNIPEIGEEKAKRAFLELDPFRQLIVALTYHFNHETPLREFVFLLFSPEERIELFESISTVATMAQESKDLMTPKQIEAAKIILEKTKIWAGYGGNNKSESKRNETKGAGALFNPPLHHQVGQDRTTKERGHHYHGLHK